MALGFARLAIKYITDFIISNKLSESTVTFKESLNNVESKLKQCMIINVVTIILMVIILFFLI